jgi:outer membrane protein assembly factor BamB
VPKAVFAVRFENEPAYSGQSRLCGQDQIVFLHGDTLARYDLKTKKEIWSRPLVDKKQIAAQAAAAHKKLREAKDRIEGENPDADIKLPDLDKMTRQMERAAAADLDLRVFGQNVWVAGAGKLVRYDWDTGQPSPEVPLAGGFAAALVQGDELQFAADSDVITHLNLVTGQSRTETIAERGPGQLNKTASSPQPSPPLGAEKGKSAAPKPSEADKLAARAQKLALPGRVALPATLAVGMNQDRALAELRGENNGQPRPAAAPAPDFNEHLAMVPARDGFAQFSVKLLESKVTARSAVKAPPKKSALDGSLSGVNSGEAANELLNEMQRNKGGDIVYEDQSRYAVTIRAPGDKAAPDWTGEVTGSPELYPLPTVNVLAAGKTLIVLDRQNKEKWRSTLNFPIARGSGSLDAANAPNGLGPVVERGDTLYVFDQGVLAAFDLATGTARWRLPAVGITSLFFDDAGMIYVNSTTASPESIKYSRQIDLSQKPAPVVMKLDPRTGKTLWSTQPGGVISYLSGKFIYTLQSYRPDDAEEEDAPDTGLETPPYLRLRRLNPENGKVLWEHFQQRAPLDVQFDRNSIQLVFKKEVQVLRYLAF